MSEATFEPVDRLGGGRIRGVQQVQALRWESTFDMNKETSGQTRGPNDEFPRGVHCGAISPANRGASDRSVLSTRAMKNREQAGSRTRSDTRLLLNATNERPLIGFLRGRVELSFPLSPSRSGAIRRYVLHYIR